MSIWQDVVFFSGLEGIPLSDGKLLGGQGRLTDARIDCLQMFYGMAIFNNKDDVQSMQTEVLAGLYHYSGNHTYCPVRANTWCTFQADQLNGTQTHVETEHQFTQAMIDVMKPIYQVSACVMNIYAHALSLSKKSIWKNAQLLIKITSREYSYFSLKSVHANSTGLIPIEKCILLHYKP